MSIGIGVTLSKKDCPKTYKEREYIIRVSYASIVGAIVYIVYNMIFACSNIIYALGVTSWYQESLGGKHWKWVRPFLST